MKRVLTTMVVVTAFFVACKKDKPKTAPTITTAALTNITTTSATAGGTITSDGNVGITAAGIVLSKKNAVPTLTDTVIISTVTTGSFTVNLTNLDFGTAYYIRAYATNSLGTSYGDVVTLNTTNDTSKVRFTYMGQQVIYGVITSSVTGKKWMDRNLGASAKATSLTDTAGYGDLWNWGRAADGHQLRTSGKTATLASSDNPGHSNYIYNSDFATFGDWRNPSNNNLWQGSTGTNNPCPSGWHVPTKTEWEAEGISDPTSAFTKLNLPNAGFRSQVSGNVNAASQGMEGDYWTSTTTTTDSWYFTINPGFTQSGASNRAKGFAVRCIKD